MQMTETLLPTSLSFRITFEDGEVLVPLSTLTGRTRGDVTVYETTVRHASVRLTHTAHAGGVLIDLAVSSDNPLRIARIDSAVLNVGIPRPTDHVTLLGRETTQNEIRFPHELGTAHEYCETAVGLYPTLDAAGILLAGVAPFRDVCLAVAEKDESGRFTFSVKTEYTKGALDATRLCTERVYFHPAITLDAFFTVYRDLLPESTFPMPKLVGWNTWDYYLDNVRAEDIFENVTVLKEMPFAEKLDYIVIDDGWQKGWGEWVENEKFACGLSAVAEQIRAAGFLPGIWMAPVGIREDSAVFRDHPDWLCRNAAGEPLKSMGLYYVDPTHPDAKRFVLDNYRYQYDAGFRLFKMDYISPLLEVKEFYDRSATPYGVIAAMIEEVKAATGPDTVVLGCSVPLECGADVAPSMRIGLDVHNHFSHVAAIARTIAWAWMYNGKVTRIDPDFLLVRGEETSTEPVTFVGGKRNDYVAPPRCRQTDRDRMKLIWRHGDQFSAVEAETWANLVAICGGNLFLSDRMSVLNERGIGIIENAFALAGDAVRPVYRSDDHRAPSLWTGDRGLLFINWDEIPRTVAFRVDRAITSKKAFTREGDTVRVTLLPHESFAAHYS
ncbi:MAG: alpha-galactosidase [Clostridia bacterium]|nr:alpha-galactosidase [Clostridia bacterium]